MKGIFDLPPTLRTPQRTSVLLPATPRQPDIPPTGLPSDVTHTHAARTPGIRQSFSTAMASRQTFRSYVSPVHRTHARRAVNTNLSSSYRMCAECPDGQTNDSRLRL
ncbi:hypothetical protein TraAM80_09508 [Trypanosoma rangeli]|uniref:Uncharacterized protein n=1 Tax=Trypanosoma rangeli TaxID=5698 RepID=A0A3R7JUM2_TRYRA|nr:uncharacterized protein TraAM80_09508 [Trypanosoma rangeli]RNE97111.1 hypothetical protein TraAM80_09508 [Trypanosoma rangeli]|eukprot:RNE97111.1 hypothetical protein TraAM80_09508 [Trypanosoma rangeli]